MGTSPPAAMPSPSSTIARALASAVAASWWLPWADDRHDVQPAVVAERGDDPNEVHLAVRPAAHAVVGDRQDPRAERVGVAHHPAQRRPGEHLEADQRAHRIARQAEHRHAVDRAEGERLGRLDRHLHPTHLGDPAEHGLDDVVVTHADPAAGDDGVATAAASRSVRSSVASSSGTTPNGARRTRPPRAAGRASSGWSRGSAPAPAAHRR